MSSHRVIWFLLAVLFLQCTPMQPERTGMRGIWLRPPETKEGLVVAIDSLYHAGINVVFLETWYHSHVIYPSRVADQRPAFQGWDPLKVALREAHRRGMQVHAWLEVFYAFNPKQLPDLSSRLLSQHPDWQNLSSHPLDHTAEDGKIFLNPAHPEVRRFLRDLTAELCTNYKIDGLQLDYIRYPVDEDGKKIFGYDPLSAKRLEAEIGINPWLLNREQTNRWRAFVEWKCAQVTETVKELAQEARVRRPGIRLSAAVVPDYFEDRSRERTCQDWKTWVQGDVLDFVATMCFAGSDSLFRLQIQESMNLSRIPVVIGYLNNSLQDAPAGADFQERAIKAGAAGAAERIRRSP